MANENIYGGKTYINSSFVFDKTYPNYAQAQDDAAEDGVLLGRYVLIKYCDTAFSQDERIHIETQDNDRPNTEDAGKYYNNYKADGYVSKDRIVCRKEWIIGEDRVGKFEYKEIANLSTTYSEEVLNNIGAQLNKRPIFIRTESDSEIFNNGSSTAIPSYVEYGHAEGKDTIVEKYAGHAEGYKTKVRGFAGHAEGNNTLADHDGSHTSGSNTKTSRANQTVIGEYNSDNSEALFIVGNGEAYTQVPSDEIFNANKIYYIKTEGAYKKQEGITGFQDGVIYYTKSAALSNAFEVYKNGTTTPCYKIVDDKKAKLSFVLYSEEGQEGERLAEVEDWEIEEYFNKYVLKNKTPIFLNIAQKLYQIYEENQEEKYISLSLSFNNSIQDKYKLNGFGNLIFEDTIVSSGVKSLFTPFEITEGNKLKWYSNGKFWKKWYSTTVIEELVLFSCEIEIKK